MATSVSTPPPSSRRIRTPPTPRFGYEDDYQPYRTRKSTRVVARAQTPPPQPQSSAHNLRSSNSPASRNKNITINGIDTPPSTVSRKRAKKAHFLDDEIINSETLSSSTPRKNKDNNMASSSRTTMLPTPMKTPQKKPEVKSANISSIARNLFPIRHESIEAAMPSPKKSNRYRSSLAIFSEQEEEIPIYTDSKERVPEKDHSFDNPFYGPGSRLVSKSSKKNKAEAAQEKSEEDKDGMVFTFRGKKVFRKFSELDAADQASVDDSDEDELNAAVEETAVSPRLRGRMTRSSMKPRLLFPSAEQLAAKNKRHNDADEEAETDIEDGNLDELNTPTELEHKVATPKAPKFAPVSPPSTMRATRSKKIDLSSHGGRGSVKPPSPFDSWSRTKPASHKRGASALEKADTPVTSPKRLRGHAA